MNPQVKAFLLFPLQVIESIVRLPIELHDCLVAIKHKNLVQTAELRAAISAHEAGALANHANIGATLFGLQVEFRNDARKILAIVCSRYPRVEAPPANLIADSLRKTQ